MEEIEIQRPPIRWAGSKKKLISQLRELAPKEFERYVEPFCGSLCFLIALKPKKSLAGDINYELINFYKEIKKNTRKISKLVHSELTDEATYYKIRSIDPTTLSASKRAARFLYLNRFCFNGVYRTNKQGKFNVPRGKHMGSIPSTEELIAFSKLIENTEFQNSDFSSLLERSKDGDFIYLDPPYAGRGVRDRGEYGVGAFKEYDIARLYESATTASEQGAKVMISYAEIPQVKEIFKDWDITNIEVTRNVSGFVKGRTRVSELVIRNYN